MKTDYLKTDCTRVCPKILSIAIFLTISFFWLSSYALWWITFDNLNISDNSLIKDGYVISKDHKIVQMDWLENTEIVRVWLSFKKLTIWKAWELLGPFAVQQDNKLWYIVVDVNHPSPKDVILKIKVVDANLVALSQDIVLADGSNTVPVNTNASSVYIIIRQINKKTIDSSQKPQIESVLMAYGNKSQFAGNMIISDQIYANDDKRQILDIYKAPSFNDQTPVLVYMHGGGFTDGDKDAITNNPIFQELLQRWVSVVSFNYRFYPKTKFPLNYEDVMKALSFVKQKGLEFGLDASRVVVAGKSAWGISVLWALTFKDDPRYTAFVKWMRDIPTVKWILLYNTPTYHDKISIEEKLWCDVSNWQRILKYFGLPIIKDWKILDRTNYENRPRTRIDVEKSRIANNLKVWNPAMYFAYDWPLYNNKLPSNEDCLHSPNYFLDIKNILTQYDIPFEFHRWVGWDITANPSTLSQEVDFVTSKF